MKPYGMILAVEDSQDDMFLLRRALKKSQVNAELKNVGDGGEAMDYLSRTGRYADPDRVPIPDLVLLDIKLPRINGFEVLKWIRQNSVLNRLIVVMLSSSEEPRDVKRAYELHANSYICKNDLFGAQSDRMTSLLQHYWLDLNIIPIRDS